MIKKLLLTLIQCLSILALFSQTSSKVVEPEQQDFDIRDCQEALQIISDMGITSMIDHKNANLNRGENGDFSYEIAEGSYSYWYKIIAQSDFEFNFSLMPKKDSTIQFALYQVDSNFNFCESYLEKRCKPKRLVLYSDAATQKGIGLTGEADVSYEDSEDLDNVLQHTPYHKSVFIEGGDSYFLHVFKINKNEVDHSLTIGEVKIELNTSKAVREPLKNTEKLRAFLHGAPENEEKSEESNTESKNEVPLVSIIDNAENKTKSETQIKAYSDAVFFDYDEEEYEDITVEDLNLPKKETVDMEAAKAAAEAELNQAITEGTEEKVIVTAPEETLVSVAEPNQNNNIEQAKPIDNIPEETSGNHGNSTKNPTTAFTVPSVSESIKSLDGFTSSAPIYGQIRYNDGSAPSNSKLVAVDLQGNARPEYVLTNSSGIFEMYDVEAFKKVVFGFSEYDSHIDISKDPHIVGIVRDRTKIYGARMGGNDQNFEVRNIPFMDFGDMELTDAFGELSRVDFSNPEEYADALNKFGNQAIEGVAFKVQIGAFENTKRFERKLLNYTSLGTVDKYQMGDGLTRFTVGNKDLLSEAENLKQNARSTGLTDAFIVSFKNGVRTFELR